MIKKVLICLLLLFFTATPAFTSAQSMLIINLFDISGSISRCDDAFRRNVSTLGAIIDTLNKKDRFVLFFYRSHNTPVKVVDVTLPNKSGGGKRYIKMARAALKDKVAADFENFLRDEAALKKAGGGTDIIGAFQQVLLFLEDYPDAPHPRILNHFSDGVITTGIGGFNATSYKRYLKRLKHHLGNGAGDISFVDTIDVLHWYGATCYTSSGLTLTQSAEFQKQIKETWISYFSGKVKKSNYLIDY